MTNFNEFEKLQNEVRELTIALYRIIEVLCDKLDLDADELIKEVLEK